MKHIKSRAFRALVVGVAIVLLLSPGWLMATVFTSVNFILSLSVVLVSVVVAVWLPRWKWPGAIIASLLIAVPPYPFWLYASENRGWYFHFFHGFTLSTLPLGTFGVVFVFALLLFAAIFWAIDKPFSEAQQKTT